MPRLEPADVNQTLNTLMAKDWVVYSKAHLKQPDTIVRYLGRYTRKIAISESRIRTISEHHVTFDYKDYRDNKDKQMRLDGAEFLRRFLRHVLPQGFMRIRHYGFYPTAVESKSWRSFVSACKHRLNWKQKQTPG